MGRMTYVKALMCLLFPSAALVARAQHPVAGDLKCKLTGRMLMDGGVYLKNDNLFGNGTEFNDLRLGVKATYQNWSMKMEVMQKRARSWSITKTARMYVKENWKN